MGLQLTPERMAADTSIAFTYDSADDDARVTLVHSYRGSQKQMQFLRSGDSTVADLFDGQVMGARNVGRARRIPNFPVTDGKISVNPTTGEPIASTDDGTHA